MSTGGHTELWLFELCCKPFSVSHEVWFSSSPCCSCTQKDIFAAKTQRYRSCRLARPSIMTMGHSKLSVSSLCSWRQPAHTSNSMANWSKFRFALCSVVRQHLILVASWVLFAVAGLSTFLLLGWVITLLKLITSETIGHSCFHIFRMSFSGFMYCPHTQPSMKFLLMQLFGSNGS